ncbi:MAG: translation initiation factor IF-2 subunit gamma [Candidatus Micrarchaeia archaeon]
MQAEINIGLFGHVDHGKTTLTKAMSGKWTDTHSEEVKRGISIRLGYADASIYYCENTKKYSFEKECSDKCVPKEVKRISFIDAPGHETLMTTAISASSIIDCALFLISANESCPQPQTYEHFMVLESLGIENIIIVQTKIDLVSKEKALENYAQIKEFVAKTSYKDKDLPIIPVCAYHRVNIGELAKKIYEKFKTPKRNPDAALRVYISRSFDINKPGTKITGLKGGVLGGSIVCGKIKDGQEVMLCPGITRNGKTKPILVKINGLRAESNILKEAHPGGLIAMGTSLDPSITKSDALNGTVLGEKDNHPEITEEISVSYKMFKRKDTENISLLEREPVVLSVYTSTGVGMITKLKKGNARIKLKKPLAIDPKSKVAISKRIGQKWRLVAIGEII